MICPTCKTKTTHGVYEGGTSIKYCKIACLIEDWNKTNSWKITEQEVSVMEWGFKPETNVEVGGFAPIVGSYVARIDKLTRKQGTSEKSGKDYDFYSINVQVVKTLKGDKGEKRFLSNIYNPDDEGVKKLANDLFTAGIDIDTSSEESFESSFEAAMDKLITIKAWKGKSWTKQGDEFVEKKDENGGSIYKQKWSIPSIQVDTKAIEAEEVADLPF